MKLIQQSREKNLLISKQKALSIICMKIFFIENRANVLFLGKPGCPELPIFFYLNLLWLQTPSLLTVSIITVKLIPYLPCWNMNKSSLWKYYLTPNWQTTLLYGSNIIAYFDVVSYTRLMLYHTRCLSCLSKQNYEAD